MNNLLTFFLSCCRALPLVPWLPVPAVAYGSDVTSSGVPPGLTASDWGGIRAEYERCRHAAVPTLEGRSMRNPKQQWTTHCDGSGFLVTPDSGGWTWGLELKSYGFAGAEGTPVLRPAVQADGPSVTYDHDGNLQEWLVNDARGLEHGFTVRQRPTPMAGVSLLSITLAIRGGLLPAVAGDGQNVQFRDHNGTAVLNYAGLKVWDADHRTLSAHLETSAGALRLVIDEHGARYPLTIDPIAQQAYLKASNSANNDQFGWSVAVSGDIVVVGAPQESSNATGVNGNQADNSSNQAGAAYVFARTGGVWTQEAYLKASNPEALDRFGHSVAAGSDYVVVGAPEEDSGGFGINHPAGQGNNSKPSSGAAYIFVRSGGVWSQQVYVKAVAFNPENLDRFGWAMAASGDTLVIGAPDQDTGFSAGAGAAYVFVRNGGVWTQEWFLKASTPNGDDRFGTAVGVDGNTIVVGADREDSNATGVGGEELNTNGPNSGAAYVFVRSSNVWSQQAYLKSSNSGAGDSFGWSVGVAGDTVIVGANLEDSNATGVNHPTGQSDNSFGGSGAAYVFVRSGTAWSQQAYLKASNTATSDAFGYSVAASGDTAVIGSNVAGSSGAAYVFTRGGGVWSQQAILKASNAGPGDDFGWALGLSGSTLVVGAYREDSNARGVNGTQADNSAPESGAAYVFDLNALPCLQAWRQTWFGDSGGTGDEADLADKDRDGQVNLLELATGQNPLVSGPPPFALTRNGSTLEFTWPRARCTDGSLTWTVEWSDTLAAATWSTTGVTSTILSDNGTVEQIKSTLPAGAAGKRFVRLRVVAS